MVDDGGGDQEEIFRSRQELISLSIELRLSEIAASAAAKASLMLAVDGSDDAVWLVIKLSTLVVTLWNCRVRSEVADLHSNTVE